VGEEHSLSEIASVRESPPDQAKTSRPGRCRPLKGRVQRKARLPAASVFEGHLKRPAPACRTSPVRPPQDSQCFRCCRAARGRPGRRSRPAHRGLGDCGVTGHFGSLIPGDRQEQRCRQVRQPCFQCVVQDVALAEQDAAVGPSWSCRSTSVPIAERWFSDATCCRARLSARCFLPCNPHVIELLRSPVQIAAARNLVRPGHGWLPAKVKRR
jgi:hypothetical protein